MFTSSIFTSTIFNRIALTTLLFATSFVLAQAPEAPPAKPLPPGPMQPKIKAACLQCHNASRITDAHFSRTQWSDELDKMVGLGASSPRRRPQSFAGLSDHKLRSAKGRRERRHRKVATQNRFRTRSRRKRGSKALPTQRRRSGRYGSAARGKNCPKHLRNERTFKVIV